MEQKEQIKSQVSAFMDGEVAQEEVALLCKRISADPELRGQWRDHHLISDALKQQLPERPMVDISARVSAALQDESALGAGNARPGNGWLQRASGMAVAASVAVFGVVAVVNMTSQQNGVQMATVAQNSVAQPSTQLASVAAAPTTQIRSTDPRLNKYLVDHSEYALSASVHSVLPYARIVGQQHQLQRNSRQEERK